MSHTSRTCPHCGSRLRRWRVPDEATWDEEFFFVCFDDDCSYFKAGWDWMKQQYNQQASYRYAVNPTNDAAMMIPVWSRTATREMIEDEAEGNQE